MFLRAKRLVLECRVQVRQRGEQTGPDWRRACRAVVPRRLASSNVAQSPYEGKTSTPLDVLDQAREMPQSLGALDCQITSRDLRGRDSNDVVFLLFYTGRNKVIGRRVDDPQRYREASCRVSVSDRA